MPWLLSGDCRLVVGYGVPMGSGRVARFCAQTKFVLTGIGGFAPMISWHDVHGHAPMKCLSTCPSSPDAGCPCRCRPALLEDSATCCWCAATPTTFHAHIPYDSSCRTVLGRAAHQQHITDCVHLLRHSHLRNITEVGQPPCCPCSRHPEQCVTLRTTHAVGGSVVGMS